MDSKLGTFSANTELARQAFSALGAKEMGKNSFTFGGIRQKLIDNRQMVREALDDYDRKIAEIRKDYRPEAAARKIAELKPFDGADDFINEKLKEQVREDLGHALTAKKDRLANFVCKAPSADQVNLLQMIKMRDTPVSDVELQMLIPKFANNYAALTALQTATAIDGTPRFQMPTDLEKTFSALDYVETGLNVAIAELDRHDRELSINSAHIYTDGAGGKLNALIDELDKDYSFIDQKRTTTLEDLKLAMEQADSDLEKALFEARNHNSPQTAKEAGSALARSRELNSFYEAHKDELRTDADAAHEREAIEREASELING